MPVSVRRRTGRAGTPSAVFREEIELEVCAMAEEKCPSCGQIFTTKREADEHAREMHAGKKGGEREPERRAEVPPRE